MNIDLIAVTKRDAYVCGVQQLPSQLGAALMTVLCSNRCPVTAQARNAADVHVAHSFIGLPCQIHSKTIAAVVECSRAIIETLRNS